MVKMLKSTLIYDAAETLSESIKLLKAEYTLKAIEEHKMDQVTAIYIIVIQGMLTIVVVHNQALIFCRTKLDCDNLEHYLLSKGGGPKALVNKYSCVCLHSDRAAAQRKANLQAFKVELTWQ